MEQPSQLSVTRKTAQLSFKVKAYHRRFPISFSIFPTHFKITVLQPEVAADRVFIAPREGILQQTHLLGVNALAKKKA